MAYYRTCPDCGCSLDPGERCDCRDESEKQQKEYEEVVRPGRFGQMEFDFDYKRAVNE